jgi:hypothetical protein
MSLVERGLAPVVACGTSDVMGGSGVGVSTVAPSGAVEGSDGEVEAAGSACFFTLHGHSAGGVWQPATMKQSASAERRWDGMCR